MPQFYKNSKVFLVGHNTICQDNLIDFLADEYPVFDDDSALDSKIHSRILRWTNQYFPSDIAEIGGRLCYMSFNGGREDPQEYLDHIKEVGHGSVLEHCYFSFIITGVSRTLTHELVRHRAGMAFSQLSQRYVDSSKVGFVIPPEMLGDDHVSTALRMNFKDCCEDCLHTYKRLLAVKQSSLKDIEPDPTLQKKRARQLARSVLPGCTETKILVSCNARALRHFIEMRANKAAAFEIRRLAVNMLRTAQLADPRLFSDYNIITLDDGTEAVETEWRKV